MRARVNNRQQWRRRTSAARAVLVALAVVGGLDGRGGALALNRTASTAPVALAASPLQAERDPLVERVCAAIRAYPQFSIFDDITVRVDAGAVTISGRVTMAVKRDDIEARVRRVAGVAAVITRIDVLPVSNSDSDLRRRLAMAIYGNSAFRHYASMLSPPIHIIVEHGRVTLTGWVTSEVERRLAESLASVPGALSIRNDLSVNGDR